MLSLRPALAVFGGILIAALAGALCAHADPLSPKRVTVGVFSDAPFAVPDEDMQWRGYAVDLLREIGMRSGLVPEFREYASLEALYDAVHRGEVEMGAGNTLVTSFNLAKVEFSQPILDGGLRIMVSKERGDSFARLWEGLKQNGHVRMLLWGTFVMIAASFVLLFILRKFDEEFTRHWHEGFAEAFYHVVSVCVTGKTHYRGDLAAGWIGRILAALWLCFGVGTVAYVTSSVTSVMTANTLAGEISGPKDLAGKKVAVLEGGAGERYCAKRDVQVVRCKSLDEAVEVLLARRVDAIVSDAASLESFDIRNPNLPITEKGEIFERRHFAFPVKPGAPSLLLQLNEGLLQARESGLLDHVRGEWFTQ